MTHEKGRTEWKYLDLKIGPRVKLCNQSLHLPPLLIWCCSIIMLMDSIRGYLWVLYWGAPFCSRPILWL